MPDKKDRQPQGSYQEGRVDSVHSGRPSPEPDPDPRTGHGQDPEVPGERPPANDAFVSDEVAERARSRRGRGSKTQS